MRFLVLGGSGQIGTELRARPLSPAVELISPSKSALDLNNPLDIARAVSDGPWDSVINAAAYTDVESSEKNEALALEINARAVAHLAEETGKRGIPVVHFSTDYVFDGRKGTPYNENDRPSPINAYGRSKLAGEELLRQNNPRHIILRTSWIYSSHGKNFVKTILGQARRQQTLNVISDQRGCPTTACDVARISLEIARMCATSPQDFPYGLYHCAGSAEASWFELAIASIKLAAATLTRVPEIRPIRSAEYPTSVSRPTDSRLNSSALLRTFGLSASPWQDALPSEIQKLRVAQE